MLSLMYEGHGHVEGRKLLFELRMFVGTRLSEFTRDGVMALSAN